MNIEINKEGIGGYVMGSAEHLFQAVFRDFKLDVYIDKSWRSPPTENVQISVNRRLLLSVVESVFETLLEDTQTNKTETGEHK